MVPTKNRLAGASCWLLVAGCWLLVTGYWLLVTGYWLLVTGCLLLIVAVSVDMRGGDLSRRPPHGFRAWVVAVAPPD
ncbi:MAG: hypothetical protein RI637_08085 [Acidimicrobiia bacterium]|nr:hypothetical protein [Acidimicrobiia bacterium]MDR9451160.1 hypothetical protein [Acidimicrobiia bacterium]